MFPSVLTSVADAMAVSAAGLGGHGGNESTTQAVYECTRTVAVTAGGVLGGAAGGPVGSMLGGVGAGIITDTVATIVMDEPQGVICGITNIVTDIQDGQNPLGSVLDTGLLIGVDAFSGYAAFSALGAGNATGTLMNLGGKSMGEDLLVAAIRSQSNIIIGGLGLYAQVEVARRIRQRLSRCSKYTQGKSGGGGSGGTSGSGSQPPRDNRGDDEGDHEKDVPEPKPGSEEFWALFFRIFEVESLDNVRIGTRYPFRGLERRQKKELEKLIRMLIKLGHLEQTVTIVLVILDNIRMEDAVTFHNFLSLAKFVSCYIGDQVAEREGYDRYYGTTTDSYNERRRQILYGILMGTHMGALITDILGAFQNLWEEISQHSCDPSFRSMFSAIYHYYSHRLLPATGSVLSVEEYFQLINSLLTRLKTLVIYGMLGRQKYETVFEVYYAKYGRRVKIVVKYQDGRVVLASCYVLKDPVDGDEDGDEYSESVKLN